MRVLFPVSVPQPSPYHSCVRKHSLKAPPLATPLRMPDLKSSESRQDSPKKWSRPRNVPGVGGCEMDANIPRVGREDGGSSASGRCSERSDSVTSVALLWRPPAVVSNACMFNFAEHATRGAMKKFLQINDYPTIAEFTGSVGLYFGWVSELVEVDICPLILHSGSQSDVPSLRLVLRTLRVP